MDENLWRKCSNCKKSIALKAKYYKCSVSSCNQGRVALQFCSVSCWGAHVPIYRHRDAGAIESFAPATQEAPQAEGTAPRTIMVREPGSSATPAKSYSSDEILVVASKLKNYIRERYDMNTSADVLEKLSDKLRSLCDDAIVRARNDGRKTVMGRDF